MNRKQPGQAAPTDAIVHEIMGWTTGNQTIALLRALKRTGSINGAAQSLGMQYKSVWQKLDQITNMLPYPLIVKKTGGRGGGGSVLTDEGNKLLTHIDMLQKNFTRFMDFFADSPQEALSTLKTLWRIEMQLSARNVWLGKVMTIDKGVVNSVVNIRLKGGDMISSVITDNSVIRLGLKPGMEVMAIVKASCVLLGRGTDPQKISARNILSGSIGNIIPGAVNDEITVDLPGGCTVTSIITSTSVQRLGLGIDDEISAIIKASDVLLAAT